MTLRRFQRRHSEDIIGFRVMIVVCFWSVVLASLLFVTVSKGYGIDGFADRFTTADAELAETEYLALYELYVATAGENWRWDDLDFGRIPWNFTDGSDPCTDNWQGIQCIPGGHEVYHVRTIELTVRNLVGTLPDSISNLTRMVSFNVPANSLRGTVPCMLTQLKELTFLSIKDNYYFGTLPRCLENITTLQHLGLDYNFLSGTIPTDMWGGFTNMSVLLLSHNRFTGTLPEVLGTITTISELYVGYNWLTGTLPTSLSNLHRLLYLDLDANSFTGTLPDFSAFTRILSLGLHGNYLTGTLPGYTPNFEAIIYLFCDDNYFSGTVPANFGQAETLRFLQVEYNLLTGTVPASLGQLEYLRYLYLNSNLLTGALPAALSRLSALESILVQQNHLTGSLASVFNHTVQLRLNTIQLSNNQFTGALPLQLFQLRRLQALVAVSNCFTGSIPQEICNCHALLTLALDGLHSASSCRHYLAPGVSKAYELSNDFGGTLPACLFALPALNTLHVSGNALTGTIPTDVQITKNLVDLSLSHNILSGTIPLVIQNRQWYNLDLSYNRFTGVLDDAFYAQARNFSVNVRFEAYLFNYTEPASTAALVLQNNRLSGQIPDRIRHMHNISILSGNLFICDFDGSDLPNRDSGRRTYQCGSNDFDVSYYVWLGLVFVVLCAAVGFFVWRERLNGSRGLMELIQHCQAWLATVKWDHAQSEETNPRLKSISYVCKVLDVVNRVALVCTLFIVLALLPAIAVAGVYFATHDHQYAYSVAGVYLSGRVPFALQMVLLLLLIALMVGVFAYHIVAFFTQLHARLLSVRFSRARSLSILTNFSGISEEQENDADHQASKLERVAVCLAFFLVSVSVVLAVNIAFVYVALYQSSTLLLVAQVLLSFFKVMWNLLASPYLIQWTSNYLYSKATLDRKLSRTGFFSLQVFVAIFNNIAIPCFVVSIVDPNCLYNILVTPASETSRFLYAECDDYAVIGCIGVTKTIAASTYSPPFKYSYQCSASFVTYYAPTFMYVCIVSTFLSPLFQLCGYWLHQRAAEHSKLTPWYRFLDYFLPPVFKVATIALGNEPERNIFNPYFDPNAILVSQLTYLAILLTFGAIFPPLAVALLLTMYTSLYFEKLKIGRFVSVALEKQATRYITVVSEQCQGVGSVRKLREAVWLLGSAGFAFYTLFLFDTLGNAVGSVDATWICFVMPLTPAGLYTIRAVYLWRARGQARRLLKQREQVELGGPLEAGALEMRRTSVTLSSDTTMTRNTLSTVPTAEGTARIGSRDADSSDVTLNVLQTAAA